MESLNSLGMGGRPALSSGQSPIEFLLIHGPLDRVLSFIGKSIDDVVNDPIVKNQVFGYYKLYKQIQRAGEVAELEAAWNPLGLRTR